MFNDEHFIVRKVNTLRIKLQNKIERITLLDDKFQDDAVVLLHIHSKRLCGRQNLLTTLSTQQISELTLHIGRDTQNIESMLRDVHLQLHIIVLKVHDKE